MKKLLLLFFTFILDLHFVQAQIPSGYYDSASGQQGAQLKTTLHNIIKNHTIISYTGLWSAFYTTDDKPNGTVWDIYSDIPNGTPPYTYLFGTNQCGNTPGYENGCYNREHSFPKSWSNTGEGDTAYSDIFHLYPVDSYVNTRRNNYPYGQVNAPTWTSQNGSKFGPCSATGYTGLVFEPRDEFKGDIARTYFYVATRYENKIAGWEQNDANGNVVLNGTSYPCFETWFLNMLLAWNTADPVSQKEIDRNNTIYNSFQHNRNPFIDHPEYVNAIWAPGTGVLPEPSNHSVNFSANNLLLKWTDATGNNLPDGYLIRMSALGFNDIIDPQDGIPIADNATNINVPYGLQAVWFTNLTPNTTYYFKMYSYTGVGGGINYKTDGIVPQSAQTTAY